uniref:Uncharacterized protein n=1 Tax=Knipowitschia caucasica TaxID=637954 RepID=A0AAV2KBT2_KNICA
MSSKIGVLEHSSMDLIRRGKCKSGASHPCITPRGAACSPIPGPTTDLSTDGAPLTPPGAGGGEHGVERAQADSPVHKELWFIVVMAAIALLVMAIIIAIVLNKALNKPPFSRERPPLVATTMEKRSPMAVYPPSNSMLFDTVPDTTAYSNSVTLKGFTLKIEEVTEGKCEEDLAQAELGILSVNSLRRSVSQVMDGKSVAEDSDVWDPNINGHDSGMFMDDETFVDSIKGFSTVKKEHTMFTDTNL